MVLGILRIISVTDHSRYLRQNVSAALAQLCLSEPVHALLENAEDMHKHLQAGSAIDT